MKDASAHSAISTPHTFIRSVVFWLSLFLLVSVPLAFSTAIYRTFSLPKFLILLTGSSALIPLIALIGTSGDEHNGRPPWSRHLLLVSAYVAMNALSTALGATPVASFFGSYENQMGLLTQLCFYVCFIAIVYGTGQSWARLEQMLWAISITGLCTATYAFAQFFGRDSFLPPAMYTATSMGEKVVRPIGTLGHADYLGNYLLYTTPLWMGLAVKSAGSARRFGILASGISIAAIAFSGTRGAWLGLIVGGLVFLALELPKNSVGLLTRWVRPRALRVGFGAILVLMAVVLVASRQASRSMLVRARSFVTEGFTGAGRTLLWRDSLSMVPSFPIVGCAPEGFRAVATISAGVLLAFGSYSVLAINADKQLNHAFVAPNQGNLDQLISSSNEATPFFDPTGQRDFMAARALTLYAERVHGYQNSLQRRADETLTEAKSTALNLAVMHAKKSLARTLEPDSNNLLLAYLAYLSDDAATLHEYAGEAVRLDPYFSNARWLMSEAYLAEGDRERAANEAQIALEFNPSQRQARWALKRANSATQVAGIVEESLNRARLLVSEGKTLRAERVLLRALRRSRGKCADCHRLLAMVYEQANLFVDAIEQWQAFLREAPDRVAVEQAAHHIETLKQKISATRIQTAISNIVPP